MQMNPNNVIDESSDSSFDDSSSVNENDDI